MEKEIISDCVVLSNNIDAFIELGEKVLTADKQKKFITALNACKKDTGAYYLSTLDNTIALQGQANALKSKKIDSAIAGGIMDGLAGPGAGICGALGNEKRNQDIDTNRRITAQKVSETKSVLSQRETALRHSYKETMDIISSNTELKNMMDDFRKQKQTKDAEIEDEKNKNNSKIDLIVALVFIIIALSTFITNSAFLSIIIGLLSVVLLGKLFKLF